ncbi:MAG: hypothetical protein HF981_01585 [Desulfobacteraceae bacterium]|nr:hypothetical protein [Desulfobacteraceae bacterium]MBC2749053.1 hypothetical protein [Desulfobacteraceae bacterium]
MVDKRAAKKSKKKLARKHKISVTKNKELKLKYPNFILNPGTTDDVPQEYIDAVFSVINSYVPQDSIFNDRKIFTSSEAKICRKICQYGFDRLSVDLNKFGKKTEIPKNLVFPGLSKFIYDSLDKNGLNQKFRPFLTFDVFPFNYDLVISFPHLKTKRLKSNNKIYFSENIKQSVVNYGTKKVAFTKHAIDRIHDRETGGGGGNGAIKFTIRRFSEKMDLREITFPDGQMAFQYFRRLKSEHPHVATRYTRVSKLKIVREEDKVLQGYFPFVIEDDYVVLKTFLMPGMTKTPESYLVKNAEHTQQIEYFKKLLKKINFTNWLTEDYIQFLEWCQENGISQYESIIINRLQDYGRQIQIFGDVFDDLK